MLTLDAYRAIGGVSGALAGRAEEIYDGARPTPAQDAARQLFLRLVTLGEGAEDTRRRVERTEFASIEVDQTAMSRGRGPFGSLAAALVRPRPAQRDADGRGGARGAAARVGTLPALDRLRARPRPASPAPRDRGAGVEDADREPSFLSAAAISRSSSSLADESDIALTELEREFIDASRAANELELARRQRQNRRLAARSARSRCSLLAVVAGIIALLSTPVGPASGDRRARPPARLRGSGRASNRPGDASRARVGEPQRLARD